MQKSTLVKVLNELPSRFSLDEFIRRLIVIEKIDEGLDEAKKGRTMSHDKLKKITANWGK